MIPMTHILALSTILLCIGAYGVLRSRNAIIVLMCIEVMLNAVNINFVAFSRYHGTVDGQVFALFSIAIAAAEVALGLAIFLALFKRHKTIDTGDVRILKW
jgi:NADH-quinone oxidoreductase subunit K